MLLFYAKTIVKESGKSELAHLKKKKNKQKYKKKNKKKNNNKKKRTFWLSGDFLVQYFHDAF